MKTKLKYGIATYSGTIDEITFGSYKNDTVCIARKYVKPRLTENNTLMGDIAKNLSTIYAECSELYKSDLRTYADLYGKQKSEPGKLAPNGYSLFIKMMFAFAEANEASITLDTITFNDIQSLFSDITSVALAVESGYLPNLNGAELLTATM
jgi:hypothetical protein